MGRLIWTTLRGFWSRWAEVLGIVKRNPFFFQAEAGIRHLYVTGVQTCALPIWNTAGRLSQLPLCEGLGRPAPPAACNSTLIGAHAKRRPANRPTEPKRPRAALPHPVSSLD